MLDLAPDGVCLVGVALTLDNTGYATAEKFSLLKSTLGMQSQILPTVRGLEP